MFKSIATWFSKVFKNGLDILKPTATVAVKVVNVIKDVVNSPSADLLVNLTNTDIDNKILAKIRLILPKVANMVLTADILINSGTDEQSIINALIAFLRAQGKDVQANVYIILAARIAEALEDGKITLGEAVSITQIVYESFKK